MADEVAKKLEETKVEDGAPAGAKEQVIQQRTDFAAECEYVHLTYGDKRFRQNPSSKLFVLLCAATASSHFGVCTVVLPITCGRPAVLQIVTPWEVAAEGGINYDKLLSQFGCQKISPELVAR